MDAIDAIRELYSRLPSLVHDVVDGLDLEHLAYAPSPEANTVAWLVWHLTRVQDHHVAELMEVDQVWVGDDWAGMFGLDPDPTNTGFGHTPEQMAAVRPAEPSDLLRYNIAVSERTASYLDDLNASNLNDIVDKNWDPPVTRGVRLISVADDSLQHLGQASYLRGLIDL